MPGLFDNCTLNSSTDWDNAYDLIIDYSPSAMQAIKPVEKAVRAFFGKTEKRLRQKDVSDAVAEVRRTTKLAQDYDELLEWTLQQIAVVAPKLASISLDPSLERYAEAYRKSRFWWGVSKGDAAAIAKDGMKIACSCVDLGDKNPGSKAKEGGGPLCIGMARDISKPYAGRGMFRIFFDLAKCRTWRATPAEKFVPGDTNLWRDRDNASAAVLMCDVPPQNILYGTHSDVILREPDSTRSQTILAAIASFDSQIPANHGSLVALHRKAIEERYIGDSWENDSTEGKSWLNEL